jgi:hypothetical protein
MINITRIIAAIAVAIFTAACVGLSEIIAHDPAHAHAGKTGSARSGDNGKGKAKDVVALTPSPVVPVGPVADPPIADPPVAAATPAAAVPAAGTPAASAAVDLLERGLDGLVKLGGANWSFANGVLSATGGKGPSLLLTPDDYTNFLLNAEFYVPKDGASGIYFRCADRKKVSEKTCYDAKISNIPADPSGQTWNKYAIRAEGDHIVVSLNGHIVVDTHDAPLASGPIALHWISGAVVFRNVRVRRL